MHMAGVVEEVAMAGIHDMQTEVGPSRPAGWAKNVAGSLVCKWVCTRCGAKAGNSSRLMELLRKPCGSQVRNGLDKVTT